MSDRASYVAVGKSMRVSISAALAANPPLPASCWRVLAAIIHDVPSYSRIEDRISRKDIAARAGLSERTVRRAIKRLVKVGAIQWLPGTGRGHVSRVSLPTERVTDVRPPYAKKRVSPRGPLSSKKGDTPGPERVTTPNALPAHSREHREGSREETNTTEKKRRSRRDGNLREVLMEQVADEEAVSYALEQLNLRIRAGEEISSPFSWCRKVAGEFRRREPSCAECGARKVSLIDTHWGRVCVSCKKAEGKEARLA